MNENINIEVTSQPVPVVEIKVDENSAQAAKDAAALAQEILTEIQEGDFAGFLPKSTYEGNAQDLDNAIKAIQFPDSVTKTGVVTLAGLNASVAANTFNWRIDQVLFENTAAFSTNLIAASDNNFRYDLLQGNNSGGYSIKQGIQGTTIGTAPQPDINCVALASILILGNTIQGTTPNAPVDISNKLDKGGYVGTGMSLHYEITALDENLHTRIDDVVYDIVEIQLPLKANQATTYTKTEVIDLDAALVTALKDGVNPSGDTLQKLYNLIVGSFTEVTVANIAARNAFNITVGNHVFVTDDGDGKWALYKATTSGVNATYVKLSDPDLLNALMSNSAIKTAYESNSDTNAFTNALLAKLNAVDQSVSTAEKATWNAKQNTLTDADFGTFSNNLTAKSTLVDADTFNISDSADGNKSKKLSWLNFKSVFKTVGGVSIFGSGNIATGGGGDMTLAATQTVSGLKTFLSGMLGLRNVANTFTSFFTNANTASRTYTLPDRSGTIADLTDIAGVNTAKMNTPAGTTNFLSKFLSATTIGLSRLFDDGSFFGIATQNAPSKDITLGNQSNREIGIEESGNITVGRNLILSAGRTINYVPNVNFIPLGQTSRSWFGMTASPNGNVYANISSGDIYMQNNGTGNFILLGQTSRNWVGMTASPNGNVYACVQGGDIYMQNNGTGNFIPLGQTSRNWVGMTASPNGNVYACVNGGDIYMQNNGTGNFILLGQTSRNWFEMTASPNGNVYASVQTGDIYMQNNGTGNFIPLGQTSRNWVGMTASQYGNVYACVNGGDIYMQNNGTGNFIPLGQTSRNWVGMTASQYGNVYACVQGGDIYMQYNNGTGTSNLNGGFLRMVAGTGKGTGQSRTQIITGQKTTSGTNMQLETLRAEYDENGNYKRIGTPVYESNALAIAGGLEVGMEYRNSVGAKFEVY